MYIIDFESALHLPQGPGMQHPVELPPSALSSLGRTHFDPYAWDMYCVGKLFDDTIKVCVVSPSSPGCQLTWCADRLAGEIPSVVCALVHGLAYRNGARVPRCLPLSPFGTSGTSGGGGRSFRAVQVARHTGRGLEGLGLGSCMLGVDRGWSRVRPPSVTIRLYIGPVVRGQSCGL